MIRFLYEAHARRDIDGALSALTDDVSWPDVAGRRTLHGHDEARRYWTEQFATIDPSVSPLDVLDVEVTGDTARVRARQVVRDRSGNVLHEGTVVHVFTFDGELISGMHIEAE
ncbi:MAG TPA: nuclear transport factor 2 family protein [Ilumatobacteraceae bacterium]|nr:nuclear transport factor 2 family protein [Ilumatobacteraceae bacterium]